MSQSPQPIKRLTMVQFHKVCECLKKNKAYFHEIRPTMEAAAVKISEMVGFTVSHTTLVDVKEATGIDWKATWSRETGISNFKSHSAVRELTSAVRNLYIKLGDEVPIGVESLHQHFMKIARGDKSDV